MVAGLDLETASGMVKVILIQLEWLLRRLSFRLYLFFEGCELAVEGERSVAMRIGNMHWLRLL